MKFWKIIIGFVILTSNVEAGIKDLNELKAPFKLAPLPYSPESLEIAIDKETMQLHHGKHHQAYVDKLNEATKDNKINLLKILLTASKHPEVVRNNAGGHWNHTFFWEIMSGDKKNNDIPKELRNEIEKTFGSWEKFTHEFEKAGASRFGSGWAWLIRNKNGQLQITSTPNQDNPIMDVVSERGWPIFGVDVWEHSYYLRYQNKRADYLKNFWKVVNWKKVQELNQEVKSMKFD